MDPAEVLGAGPVVPVIVIEELNRAVPLARALLEGGVRVLEITLRTPVAVEAIRLVSREVPEVLVGAGTVVTPEQLRAVEDAGALFAISPGLTPDLLEAANGGGIGLIPGISTVSELMTGMERGYDHFKFFPAEAAGGVKMLRSIGGPFPQVTFCPTGGVTPDNYRDYLKLDSVACVGGSWLVPAGALLKKDWQRITALASGAVAGAEA
jgi:2-dehydro-3-deoxyphosphogluconate aldolase/(4S)-4-hydroxy-2-oxoglutarate aldolase